MTRAIIFDMDGVLVDSERVGLEAAQIAFKKYGANITKNDVLAFLGAGTRAYVEGLAKKYRIKKNIDELIKERFKVYQAILKRKGLPQRRGAVHLLTWAKKNGIKTSLASASTYHKIHLNLKAGKIPERLFDTLVSGTTVKHYKPWPDIFLAASNRLKVKPSECIVIEDSEKGIQAAKRAGMIAIAVLGTFPKSRLKKAGADAITTDSTLASTVKKIANNTY